MIINKVAETVNGIVVYSYSVKENPFSSEFTDDTMWESRRFKTLAGLLKLMTPEVLEEVKEDFGAHRVWISTVSFEAESDDTETKFRVALHEERINGWVTTKIDNEDINNRIFDNLRKVKEIVDNALDEYPQRY